jgi:cellulose synthase/poly-beta-1,6-N-acetylglucosamine synthase-like glycosyltransferase
VSSVRGGKVSTSPLVSVLLPVHTAADTLVACLASIVRQRLADWECVLVDDGSDDETPVVAARAAARESRLRVITVPHGGIVSALTIGLDACRGTYIARMDADDLMHRNRLLLQSAALEGDPGLAAVGCHVRMFPRAHLTAGRRAYERWLNSLASEHDLRRDAWIECPLAHPGLMVRRRVLQEAGYRNVEWPEDYDLLLRLYARGARVGVVPGRLVAWRDTPGRLSRRDARYALPQFTACKAAFLADGFLAGRSSYSLWGYGGTGRALARALERRGKRVSRIFEVHPGRVGQRIGGAPVLGLDALAETRDEPLIVSVAGAGPRAEIRAHLARLDFTELRDYVCAA